MTTKCRKIHIIIHAIIQQITIQNKQIVLNYQSYIVIYDIRDISIIYIIYIYKLEAMINYFTNLWSIFASRAFILWH